MSRWAVGLVLLGLGALAACGGGGDAGPVKFRVPVTVEEVVAGDVEDRIVATGTLRAEEVVSLTVENRGMLQVARSADGRRLGEGDGVSAGQEVARITGEDVRVAARTAANRQRFLSAKADLENARRLHEEGLNTTTELRAAETAFEEARLEYDRSRLSEVRNTLTTPIDGVILTLARDAEGRPLADGQLVGPGAVIAQVAPTDLLIADVDILGPDIARVSRGQRARVRHHAWPDAPFDGEVVRLAPTVDAVTRALRVEVEVTNAGGRLRPGMFAEVELLVERRVEVPVAPRDAVTERAGKRVVFVLRGQRVAQREVELGLGDDRVVELRSGVEIGDRVVVQGLETLADDVRVRVTGDS
jgi:membrane fusion protein (multidrug efflux system)